MQTDPYPLGQQRFMHPGTTIPLLRLLMNATYLSQQNPIGRGPTALLSPAPGIVATTRYLQQPTQQGHRIQGLLRRDKPIPHVDSLAKKAVAFFNTSRSMRKRSFSRRSWRTSSFMLRVSAGVFGALSAVHFHRLNTDWGRPNSSATCRALLPLVRNSRTASRRNSSVYTRFFVGHLLGVKGVTHKVSVKIGYFHRPPGYGLAPFSQPAPPLHAPRGRTLDGMEKLLDIISVSLQNRWR